MKGRFQISAGAVLLLSALYYLGGLGSLAALITAALVHEAGHIAALIASGVTVEGIRFSASGICMSVGSFKSPGNEIFCLASGPLAGLVYAFAVRDFYPPSAQYSLMLTVFNILPVSVLDGGRILNCVLGEIFGMKNTGKISDALGMTVAVSLTLAGLMLLHRELGAAVFCAGIYLLIAEC